MPNSAFERTHSSRRTAHWDCFATGSSLRAKSFAYINFMPICHGTPDPRSIVEVVLRRNSQKIEPVNLVPKIVFYLGQYRLNQRDLSVMREIYDQEINYIDGYIHDYFHFLLRDGNLRR